MWGFLLYKRNVFGYFSYNIIDTNELLTFKSNTMYKELIKIGQNNIQYLKSCMNICEAQLWGGPRYIKQKYLQQLEYFKKKLKEEEVYIGYHTEKMELDNELKEYYKNKRQVQMV